MRTDVCRTAIQCPLASPIRTGNPPLSTIRWLRFLLRSFGLNSALIALPLCPCMKGDHWLQDEAGAIRIRLSERVRARCQRPDSARCPRTVGLCIDCLRRKLPIIAICQPFVSCCTKFGFRLKICHIFRFAGFNAANPDKALDRVKALDYSGTDGMYIFPKTYEPYYADSGKSLEFYKDLNVSWGNYQNYFSPMSVFSDPSAFDDCSHPTVASDGVMDDYITFTGDVDAIVTVNGQRKWTCYQAAGDGTVKALRRGGLETGRGCVLFPYSVSLTPARWRRSGGCRQLAGMRQ